IDLAGGDVVQGRDDLVPWRRFWNEPDRTESDRVLDEMLFLERRDDHHRRLGELRPELEETAEPAHAGNEKVQEREIRFAEAVELRHQLVERRALVNLHPTESRFHRQGERTAYHRVVICDQNPFHRRLLTQVEMKR